MKAEKEQGNKKEKKRVSIKGWICVHINSRNEFVNMETLVQLYAFKSYYA